MLIKLDSLIELAKTASEKAYAPYSSFPVGCVILSSKGKTYTGCNIENISFGLTICAERAAVSKGISEEGPDFKIQKVVVFTPTKLPITPCGACRQVLREFGDNFEIISACLTDKRIEGNISFFLPNSPDIKF